MAENMDTRIIQMKFENREFEKNIAKSKKSVEELKEAMDFDETSRGLEKFAEGTKVLGFDVLSQNVEKLMNKFTGLGTVSEYVLSRLRSYIEGAAQSVEGFIKSLTTSQISVGEFKYDSLNKAVMTIISGGQATEKEAYETMGRVATYTDQTSHNFETMVSKISDLTSRGMGLDEAERLVEAMGNAATYAGQDATNAAMSMNVLSKAMASQYLGLEQYQQLANTSKVVTVKWKEQALEAAEAVGTLKRKNDKLYTNVQGQKAVEVSIQNLESTLRSRWLTSEVLKKIYENYMFGATEDELAHPEKAVDSFGKTAYLTGQRALTLKDALNAIRESVSSGWMQSFRYIWGDVTEAAEHFTNICNRVIESLEKIRDFRNGILQAWSQDGTGRSSLMRILFGDYEEEAQNGVVGFMDLLDGLGKIIYDGLVDFLYLFADPVQRELMRKGGPAAVQGFLASSITHITDGAQQFLQGIHDFLNANVTVGGATKTRLEVIHEIVMGIAGALKFAYDILGGVRSFIEQIGVQLTPSFDAIITFFGKLGEEIYKTSEEASDEGTILKFFTDLANTLKPVTDGVNAVVSSVTNLLSVLLGLDNENEDRTKTLDKIGSVLLTLADVVAKVTGPILTFLSSVIDAVTELLRGGVTTEKFQEFGKKLGNAFQAMMKTFADTLPESFGFMKNWIYDLFGLWEEGTENESNSFFAFLHKLFTGKFGNLGELLTSFTQGFDLKTALESGFGFISAFNFLGQVIGFFKGTNLYGLIMAFLGVASLAALKRLINRAREAVSSVADFFDDVGGNLFRGIAGEYEWTGERIVRILEGIGIVVACVAVLGSMRPESMIQGILGVTAVMVAVAGLLFVIDKFKGNYLAQMAMETMIWSIVAFVVAVTIGLSVLSLAILPLASDWKRMLTAVLGLVGMLAALGGFMVIMIKAIDALAEKMGGGKLGEIGGLIKIAAIMIGISVAILTISKAISILAVALTPLALTGWGGMFRAIIGFAGILAVFGAFIVIMTKAMDGLAKSIGGGSNWKGYAKMAIAILALSASVTILSVGIGALAIALTPLALMSWGGFIRAIAGLGLILLELSAMMKFLQKLTVDDKTASLKIAGFAAFAFSIGILISALTPLALMTWNAFARAMVGLTIVLTEMLVVMAITSKANIGTGKLLGFAGFAASIGILMFSLAPIAAMDWNGMWRAVTALGLVLTEMLIVMAIVKKFDLDVIKLTGFIGFAASIAILLLALTPIATMRPEQMVQGVIALATVMLEIMILMQIMKEMQPDLKTAGSTLMLLIGLGAAMILFSIAFNEVKNVPWENIVAFAAGISILLLAVGKAAQWADKISIKGILMLSLGLAAILGVLALMIPVLAGSIGSSMSDLAARMSMFSQLMSIFSEKMGNVDEGSVDKATNIIKKLTGLFESMIAIKLNEGNIRSYEMCISRLTLIADQLGIFQGKMAGISPASIDTAKEVLGKISNMLGGEASAIAGYYNKMSLFSTAMYNLGTGIEIFNNHTQGITDPENNDAVKLIQALSGCASDLDVIYKMDIDTLTSKLTGLGGAMMIYAQGAKDVAAEGGYDPSDPKSVGNVNAAIELLKAISTTLASEGGVTIPENMPSTDDLGLFGAQLAALAGALIQFEQAGANLGTGTDKALETLTFFQKLKEQLTLTSFTANIAYTMDAFKNANGELIQTSELETFGKNIEQLGLSLGQFAQSTTYVDEQTHEVKPIDFSNATTALDEISKVGEKLPSVGGAIEIIIGRRKSLEDLASEINLLGSALGTFYTSTGELDETTKTIKPYDFTNTIAFLNSIGSLQNDMPYIGGFNLRRLIFGDQMTFDELGAQLAELGAGLNIMSASITGTNEDGTQKFDAAKATEATQLLNDQIVPALQGLSSGLSKIGGIGRFFSTLWNGREQDFTDVAKQMEAIGPGLAAIGSAISGGGYENADAVNNAMSTLESIISLMVKLQEFVEYSSELETLYGVTGFDMFEHLGQFLDLSVNGGEVWGNKYNPIIGKIASFIESLDTQLSKYAGTMEKMEAIQDRAQIFKIFAEGLNALTGVNPNTDWKLIGENLTNDVATAITDGASSITTAYKNMMTTVYTNAQTVEGADWKELGKNIGAGVVEGINFAGPEWVTPAVRQMMIDAYNAGKQAIDSNSPSKLFMTLGAFAGEGMAIGIQNETGEVGKSAGMLGDVALENAKDMVALISRIMTEDINAQPTIAPVLDMTNIDAGLAQFDASMAGRQAVIDTTVAAANLGAVAGSSNGVYDISQLKPDYTGVYERMDILGEQINQLGEAISKIKIVLNTGVVAGGITDDVDQNLGRKSFYAGRNN